MNIRFLFNEVRIDDRTQDYITEKITRLEKFFESQPEDAKLEAEVEIELDKKGKFRVEVMMKTPYEKYRGEEISESIEGSVDLVYEELEKQIRRDKEKNATLRRRGGRSIKKKITLDENSRF